MVTYPKDWREKTFNAFLKIKRGASPRPIESYLTSNIGGVNWIKIGDAPRYGKYITSTEEKITTMGAAHSVRVFPGDFILSNSMSFGRPYILSIAGCIHDGWLRLYDFQAEADDEFLYYLLSSSYVQRQYESFAAGSGVQNLNKEVVKNVVVCIPSLTEQKKIAQTLSSFDTYIDDLAELIEKKRGIRDGALEDLVGGHTRLKGYDKAWTTYSFDDYFSLLQTNTYARDQLTDKGNIGDVHYGDVLVKYGAVLTDKDDIPRLKNPSCVKERSLLKQKDVLIADTAEDDAVGKVVQVGAVTIPLVGGLHTVACRPNYETADGFLGYYMNSTSYHDQLYPYITGIKVSSVSKKSFSETELYIPSDIKEQKAIADTLTAMDEEIEALENERDKMIQIREGAMDDLLTGRVRLSV